MEISKKELENKLLEAGNKLLSPPASSTELLVSLALVENLLGGVEQSPTKSMKEALVPSTKALIAEELLRHSNADVKVAVASCISEITRITAPDAPYADDHMKEIFQLIVSSFEKLDDKSSLSYARRTSILETVAKVRSCVVMLDLECDELIVDMFRHFFRTIRDDHNEGVFSSMETIMSLVVEESEEISPDLLSSILEVLKKENKEILPIACQLGEKVIGSCASKLKPYLLQALRSSGASLNDYRKVVADVCQAGDEAVEPTDGDDPNENVVAMVENMPPSEEVGSIAIGSRKTVMSNGFIQKGNDNSNAVADNTKEADLGSQDENTDTISDTVVSDELPKPKTKPEKSNNTFAHIDNSEGANLNEQGEKAEPSETISVSVASEEPLKIESEKSNTSAANNSMEADLNMLEENVERSETIGDTVVSEEQPESKTIPEKPNSSEVIRESKEADIDTVDEKAAPSEIFSGLVGHEELPKSKSEPGKSNDSSAANDISKKVDVDWQDERVEASEMIGDSLCSEEPQNPKCETEILNNASAANDISKEADAVVEDDEAERSEMIADSLSTEEPPKSKSKPEKSHNTYAASDNSKENDLYVQDEKAEPSETIADSVGSKKPQQSKTKSRRSKKRKGSKSIYAKRSAKPLKPEVSDRMTEVVDTTEHPDNTKDADNMHSEDPAVDITKGADNEKSPEALIPSLKTSDIEYGDISSPSASESLAARQGKKKVGTTNEDETASKVDTNMESDPKFKKKDTGSTIKLNKRGNKKASSVSDHDEGDGTDDMEEDDSMDELDGNSDPGLAEGAEVGGSQWTSTKKQRHVKPTPAKAGRKTPAKDEKEKTAGSLKSTPKATQDESNEEVLKSSYKRKSLSEEKTATKTKVYGAELVGARVEVLWPDDEMYYEGVVESFDSAKKKHKVVYEDGDIEVLNLRKENWKLINTFLGPTSEGESPHESADTDEMPQVNKGKTSIGSEAKRQKTVSSAKKSGASSSKSKVAQKSGSKQDTSRITSKPEQEASTKAGKSGSKLFKGTLKSSEQSEDDDPMTPKSSSRTKQAMSKGALKSKGKTPKSGGKVKGGTSTNYYDTEDESSEPGKAPEMSKGKSQSTPKSRKSLKKRKRSGKK